MQKLKVNDQVVVIAGKDKGKSGKITKLDLKNSRVFVEGVNMVKKAIKPSQQNPNGGIVDIAKSIHLSNVQIASPKTGKASRVKFEVKDGKTVRIAVKCGSVLN